MGGLFASEGEASGCGLAPWYAPNSPKRFSNIAAIDVLNFFFHHQKKKLFKMMWFSDERKEILDFKRRLLQQKAPFSINYQPGWVW